jgi:hypothetical protein
MCIANKAVTSFSSLVVFPAEPMYTRAEEKRRRPLEIQKMGGILPPKFYIFVKRRFLDFLFLCTMFNTALSAASQISVYRRMLGLNSELLPLWH